MESDWPLVVHVSTSAGAVRRLTARVSQLDDRLQIDYTLVGGMECILIPADAVAERSDELWKHTCFEAFIGSNGAADYYELNAAPSRQWAYYRFTSYRDGMSRPPLSTDPEIRVRRFKDRLETRVTLCIRDLSALADPPHVRLGLSAVVEAVDGTLSYWALAHPPGRPDFHAAPGFARQLSLTGI